MTKFEIIKQNKVNYEKCLKEIRHLEGLEKLVAENLILPWIKGNKWMGGLSDSKANQIYEKLMSMGYSLVEIDDEFNKQIEKF